MLGCFQNKRAPLVTAVKGLNHRTRVRAALHPILMDPFPCQLPRVKLWFVVGWMSRMKGFEAKYRLHADRRGPAAYPVLRTRTQGVG